MKEASAERYQAVKEHLYSTLNGEAVVLNLQNGKYYGFNDVGISIWTVLQNGATVEEIRSALMSEYDIDDATCAREVETFLNSMKKENLVEVVYEKTV